MSFAQPQQDRARDYGPPVDFDEIISPETVFDNIRMGEAKVTKEEIVDIEEIVKWNLPAIISVEKEYLSKVGLQYEVPSVKYYGYRNINPPSSCELTLENAFYCLKDKAVYYDIIFLAKLVKIVKEKSGTDGKYAAIAVVGHEMGHAADYILKWGPMP
jgi:predicted metalloprotease